MDDYLPPVPDLQFPVYGLPTTSSSWRSLADWQDPETFHQITLTHGEGPPPMDTRHPVGGRTTVTTDHKLPRTWGPATRSGRPEITLTHIRSSAFIYLADRVSTSWTGSERARHAWLNQFLTNETHTRDIEDWLPGTLIVDGQSVAGLVRTAQGQAAVVAEHGEVFVSVVCEESALNDLHVVDVTVAIDAYVEGRTNLFAAHPRPTP